MASPITEKQFNELEKRISSFKATFGVFNSSTAKRVVDESFPKSVNITPENIINNSNDILFTNTPDNLDITSLSTIGDQDKNSNIKPFRVRTWVLHPDTTLDNIERLARGSFSSSITGYTENPFVERIVMPVTEVAGTDNQFYVAYGNGDAPSNKYVGSGYGTGNRPKFNYLALSALANNVLKNFLSPARYGKGYAAQVHVGDPDNYSYPQLSSEFIISPTGLDGSYEGYLFDYTEGFLFKASSGQVRGDTSDTDSAYTPYNESNKTFGDGNIDPVANNGDDGEAPIDNTTLSGYTTPYWISIYRYIGPTGFSHPSASLQADTITASNVQIDKNLNVDGTISIEGINFISTTALSNSGSSVFGDDVSQDTHRFTGSVFISGGLFVDGQSTAGGGGTGAPGIVTSIFPNPSSSTEHGNYKKTSLFPTDSNDVLEYKTVTGLKFSSSIGNPQYIILHGSQSYIETLPDRTSGTGNKSTNVYYPFNVASNLASTPYSFTAMVSQYSNPENAAGGQTYDLFRFTESSSKDYPVLTSYAPFTASKNSYTTHSFELTSSMAIAKIGIFFSRDSETVDNYNATHSIEGIKISGSHDGTTWVGLYNENVLSANESTFSSFTSLPFSSPSNLNQENFNLS